MTTGYRQISEDMLRSIVSHTDAVLYRTSYNSTAEDYARSLGEARAALTMIQQVVSIYNDTDLSE